MQRHFVSLSIHCASEYYPPPRHQHPPPLLTTWVEGGGGTHCNVFRREPDPASQSTEGTARCPPPAARRGAPAWCWRRTTSISTACGTPSSASPGRMASGLPRYGGTPQCNGNFHWVLEALPAGSLLLRVKKNARVLELSFGGS